VAILGWNGAQGPFAGNDWDRQTAFMITEHLIRGGAQVIFGVAGAAAVGSAASAARHPAVYLVGMYNDAYTVAPQYAGKWLTSVVFAMKLPYWRRPPGPRGGRTGGLSAGTIANGRVQLAPFHRIARLGAQGGDHKAPDPAGRARPGVDIN
jgi:hypothetical protein